MITFSILLIPLLIAAGFFIFGGRKVTWQEFLIHCGISFVIAITSSAIISELNTRDYEVLNGTVSNKAKERVSCEHSYTCNCITVSCGKDCSTTICQTCYEHSYDIDWAVYISTGHRLTINRITRQGLKMPPRYDRVIVGEPGSVSNTYTNYVKAAPGTLFRHQGLVQKYKSYIPEHPTNIYDYYRNNKIITIGTEIPEVKEWARNLAELAGRVGSPRQVNPIIIYVLDLPEEFAYALEEAWIGGKKNDAILVIGGDVEGNIKWVRPLAWTNSEMFKVKLRDDVKGYGNIKNRLGIITAFEYNLWNFYIRKPMSDFKYLTSSIVPTSTQFVITVIINLIISVIIGIIMVKNDYEEETSYTYRRWK